MDMWLFVVNLVLTLCLATCAVQQNCTDDIQRLERKVKHLDGLVTYAYTKPSVPATNCTLTRFTFPRVQQTEDYVRYRGYFPRLTSATVCAWVKIDGFSSASAAILSYASSSYPNQFLHEVTPSYIFSNVFRDSTAQFQLKELNEVNHICTWHDSERKVVGTFVNGEEYDVVGYKGYEIQGGGSLILGQDQDQPTAGGLSKSQAFSGTITNLMIWPRVLSQVEVLRMAGMCQCPIDHTVVMTNDRIELWGQASYDILTECPVLTV